MQYPCESSRRRFTLAHEISHILINRADPTHTAPCFNRIYDTERRYDLNEPHERMNLGECQANTMAVIILMPKELLTVSVRSHFRKNKIPVYGDCVFLPEIKPSMQATVIRSILSNEKYKGDALRGKTYIEYCISKKVRVNTGERPQYYIENNHPAIIDSATFGRVQEELARRAGKRKVKQVGTKTEQGKYCSKYALTELLICGECGTPYRRSTWTVGGQKKIVGAASANSIMARNTATNRLQWKKHHYRMRS